MKTTHVLSTAVYAQGWVEGELESQVLTASATGDGRKIEAANMNLGQFQILSKTFDEVVQQLRDLEAKWASVESAFQK